jgi:hypothetical protein
VAAPADLRYSAVQLVFFGCPGASNVALSTQTPDYGEFRHAAPSQTDIVIGWRTYMSSPGPHAWDQSDLGNANILHGWWFQITG